jgi:hypothetical protein
MPISGVRFDEDREGAAYLLELHGCEERLARDGGQSQSRRLVGPHSPLEKDADDFWQARLSVNCEERRSSYLCRSSRVLLVRDQRDDGEDYSLNISSIDAPCGSWEKKKVRLDEGHASAADFGVAHDLQGRVGALKGGCRSRP